MNIDLLSPSSFDGGHPTDQYAWLRENAPVYWHEEADGQGFWAITRYDEVAGVGREPFVYSSEPTIMIADPEASGLQTHDGEHKMMLMMDPPQHTHFRKIISREFTRGPADALRPRIQALAAKIIDAVIDDGGCEFVSQVAGELPSYVIAELTGIPLDDGRKLYELTEIIHSAPQSLPEGAQMNAIAEMFGYAQQVYQQKLAHPGEDLASQIVHAEVEGKRLDEVDFQLFFMLLIDAGGDTTRNLVAGGLHALIQHPDQFQALREDPSLLPSARDEMLRWVSPVIYMRRTVKKDTELAGQPLKAGDKIVRYFAAANRDPAKFADPERFDIRRSPNEQIAFGTGTHVCLGQHIARVEIDCMLAEIVKRLRDIEIAGDVEWLPSNFISGIRRMPVTFRAASA